MSTPVRVLLVDDSDDDVALALIELRRAGYAPVHERVDTAEAMSAALDQETWDIVLSDHNMPRFDAEEALRILRARDAELPFILVSGSIGESLAVSIMKAGASEYVHKNELSTLGAAVDRALRAATIRKEHRRAVEALRESEERFTLAVSGSRDGLWDRNLLTGKTYLSPRFKEMFSLEDREGEISFDDLTPFVFEEDRLLLHRAGRAHLHSRTPFDVEFRVHTKAGEIRWYCARGQAIWNDAGQPTRIAGSLTDLTARKRTEEALKEQLDLTFRQQEAIRRLSTPIIEVWEGVLTVPVLAALDEKTVTQMMDTLLTAASRARCQYVIIDLTAVSSVDAATATHLVRLVNAVALLGAQGIVVGIQPRVAQAIVAIGVDLAGIQTLANLREGLVFCLKRRSR